MSFPSFFSVRRLMVAARPAVREVTGVATSAERSFGGRPGRRLEDPPRLWYGGRCTILLQSTSRRVGAAPLPSQAAD